ncbi:putative Ig domain-containing protein [Streptomyces sp. ME19-01-6]|uniref:putative Ig domain-containing protein n=1 Tax=Streptomyces sp. ME19-01-6 TaxID=3028686 RepID=UPI0029BF4667|nr:putative Ig domain-containing protein [Streptomyces sp. ME19-01-6]MDX3226727.1 putative Ig domain-containing protein [Streptomyces sp. ME19-01-6]
MRLRQTRWWAIAAMVCALLAAFVPASPAAGATASDPAAGAFPTVTLKEVTSSDGFVHPGIAVSAPNLRLARQQVLDGVEPWTSYYAAMHGTKYASRTLTAVNGGSGVDTPKSDAFNSQGIESRFIQDAFGAYTQAIEYFITGDPVYRANGMHIIRTWSHMDPAKFAPYPDDHIHAGVPLMRMLAAAEIFRYSSVNPGSDGYDTAWTDADTTNLTKNLITPAIKTLLDGNTFFMNQQLYPIVGELAGYIFTDNRAGYEQAVEWFSVNKTNPNKHTNGALNSLLRVISADDPLNPYGHAFVQHQEMGRDQAHAWDGIAIATEISRMLTVQDTRLDPVAGTVSTKPDAVSPFRFGNDRLLAGADAWYAYMMGKTVPWIDTTGGPGKVSEAYRGRLFSPIDELYNIYRYGFGVDVKDEAPNVAKAKQQADGPEFFWGTGAYNFWNSNPDYNPDYWLSLPEKVAGQTRTKQTDPLVRVAQRSIPLDGRSEVREGDGQDIVRMRASKKGATIAVRTLMYDSRDGYSPVGVLIRTNGPATLEIRKDMSLKPYHTVSLPDTHGTWRYVTYDMDSGILHGSTAGDNLAYYTVVGASDVNVDIDSVNLQAKTQLTPPSFPQGQRTTLIGVAGAPLKQSLAATDSGGETLTYEASGLPEGATIDSSTGAFSWTPTNSQTGEVHASIVASDGKTDTVLNLDLVIAPDRAGALTAAQDGFDPKATYVHETLQEFKDAVSSVKATIDTADDSTFLDGLVTVQDAVKALQPLNPKLADGTLSYASLVTSSLSATNVWNMVDGDINTFSGDLRAPFTLDFGAGFRVRADAFGLQARYNFGNRSEGANVYGSNDGSTWTLLTSRETTNTTPDFKMETIPVLSKVQDKSFRFLKVQVDDPGVPTDPSYPGISSFSEFRIHGSRAETAQAIKSATLSSSNSDPKQAVNGDKVTLDLVATQPLAKVNVRIEDVDAEVTSTDSEHWRATAVLPEDVDFARALRFTADYTTADGEPGSTVFQTTDGSSLQLWNTHMVPDRIDQAWVDASTPPWPGTGTTAANGWRMFDGDIATYTDTTTSNGWVTVKPTDGSSLAVDAVTVRPRAKYASRANGTVLQGSTDGGKTWTTFLTITGVTSDQQWYTFKLPQHTVIPMLRVYDGHGGNTNIAEVQLLRFDSSSQ